MNKALKYTIYGLGGLAGLLLLGLAVIAVTFNPNDYKPLIVKLVKEKKGRTLNIEGDIKLAFWPKLGADLGRVSLSDHQAQSEFASMQSAKVFVAVMPLLKKQLVVDTVRIDGIKANIVRFKDGSTNFDDLLSKEESADIKFDIDGVLISRGVLNLKDEIGARAFSISNANISVGHIAKNEPIELDAQFRLQGNNPVINADAKLKGVLLANAAAQQFGAKDLDLALQGDVATLKGLDLKLSGSLDAKPQAMTFVADKLKLVAKANIQGKNIDFLLEAPQLSAQQDQISGKEARLSLTQTQGDDSFTAKLALADIKGSPKAFQSSGVSGEFSGKQGARTLSGNFASPFSGNLDAMVFALPRLAGRVDVKDLSLIHI